MSASVSLHRHGTASGQGVDRKRGVPRRGADPVVGRPSNVQAGRSTRHPARRKPIDGSEQQAPLLRGCPDRGGERPAREGPERCAARLGRSAQRTSHPRQWLREVQPIRHPHGGNPLMDLEQQAPLLRGCPDRGGRGRQGRGPNVAQHVWGEARALRIPASGFCEVQPIRHPARRKPIDGSEQQALC